MYVSNLEKVLQYDITLNTPADIENSLYEITFGFSSPASLQLGPDEKIYINSGSINAINFPNNLGSACGFQSNVIANQTGGGGYGLPKWVFDNTANPTLPNTLLYRDSCLGSSTFFQLENAANLISVFWFFDDPASGANNTATGLNVSHTFTQIGNYNVRAIVNKYCKTDTLYLSPLTIVNCATPCTGTIVSSDTCTATNISFNISSNNTIQNIVWNFDDPLGGSGNSSTSFMPSYNYSQPGNYTIKAIVNFNCGTDTLIKKLNIANCNIISKECTLRMPNAFSPNGDDLNDVFRPYTNCKPEKFEFVIYNRWGQLVYKSFRPNDNWDGKYKGAFCPQGTYIYMVRYKFPDRPKQQVKGTLLLIK